MICLCVTYTPNSTWWQSNGLLTVCFQPLTQQHVTVYFCIISGAILKSSQLKKRKQRKYLSEVGLLFSGWWENHPFIYKRKNTQKQALCFYNTVSSLHNSPLWLCDSYSQLWRFQMFCCNMSCLGAPEPVTALSGFPTINVSGDELPSCLDHLHQWHTHPHCSKH